MPLQQQWITKVGKCRDELYRAPTLEDLTKFVNKIAREMNDPRITGLGYQKRNETGPNSKGTVKKNAFTTTVRKDSGQSPPEKNEKTTKDKLANDSQAKVSKPCFYCGGETKHSIVECRKFEALKAEDKSKFCQKEGLCYGCKKKRPCKEELQKTGKM